MQEMVQLCQRWSRFGWEHHGRKDQAFEGVKVTHHSRLGFCSRKCALLLLYRRCNAAPSTCDRRAELPLLQQQEGVLDMNRVLLWTPIEIEEERIGRHLLIERGARQLLGEALHQGGFSHP